MSIYQGIKIWDPAGRPKLTFDRADHMINQVCGRKVLHVGCTDAPMTSERIKSGDLLHSKITDYSSETLGIDIDAPSIFQMQRNGIMNVQVMDAEKLEFKEEFDVILAGDVLEHLNNPGLFMAGAYKALKKGGKLVVGVPSALSLGHVSTWFQGRENVHKDHTSYQSPKTLAEIARREWFVPTSLTFTVQPRGEGESKLYCSMRNAILRRFPTMAPSFIMTFERQEDRKTDGAYYVWK